MFRVSFSEGGIMVKQYSMDAELEELEIQLDMIIIASQQAIADIRDRKLYNLPKYQPKIAHIQRLIGRIQALSEEI
jgi:hypothetical protein